MAKSRAEGEAEVLNDGLEEVQLEKIRRVLGETAVASAYMNSADEIETHAKTTLDAATLALESASKASERADQDYKHKKAHSVWAITEAVEGANQSEKGQFQLVKAWFSYREDEDFYPTGHQSFTDDHEKDIRTYRALYSSDPILIIKPDWRNGSSVGDTFTTKKLPILKMRYEKLYVGLPDAPVKEDTDRNVISLGLNENIGFFKVDGLHESIVVGKEEIIDYFQYDFKPSEASSERVYQINAFTSNLAFRKAIVKLGITEECGEVLEQIEKTIYQQSVEALGLKKKSTSFGMGRSSMSAESDMEDAVAILQIHKADETLADSYQKLVLKMAEKVALDAPHTDKLLKLWVRAARDGKKSKVSLEELVAAKETLLGIYNASKDAETKTLE